MTPERPPLPVIIAAAVAIAFFLIPIAGLIARAPWATAVEELTRPEALAALRVSFVVSVASTILAVFFGVPLAWLYARVAFPGRDVVRALTTLPMILPPVVGGVALLFAFGRAGLIGPVLDGLFGIRLPFTTLAAVLAWARGLGEFGATITFAGNLPGVTQTLPLAVLVALESRPEVALMLSLLLLAISAVVLVALRDRYLRLA